MFRDDAGLADSRIKSIVFGLFVIGLRLLAVGYYKFGFCNKRPSGDGH